MKQSLPDVQYVLRPGVIELRAGHPDLDLLPADGLLTAARTVLKREPAEALSYGAEQGPGRLVDQLQDWLQCSEGRATPAERLLVTGGATQALDMVCLLFTHPGDLALVQAPTYHLALRVMRDHRLELRPVPGDRHGLAIDALEEILQSLSRSGRSARMLYLVPTYSNPGATTLPLERRRALAELAERFDLLVVEDDVYYPLGYDNPAPPSIYDLAASGTVIRLGSFSKILAPGLRLGWLQAAPDAVRRCMQCGVLDSGGGLGHFTAHVVAAFMEAGRLDRQVEILRDHYRRRRDILAAALAEHLPDTCRWVRPEGGFFLWLQMPAGVDGEALLPAAEAAGVSYIPGARFFAGSGGQDCCRLNFTMVPAAELNEGARRLGALLRATTGGQQPQNR